MASVAQENANRRNAQKSTGPRTAVGKAASSQNATTHGAYATRPRAIPSGAFREDPAEVADFIENLVEALNPRDHVERIEADNIAVAYLRLRRLEVLETESLGAAGLEAPHTEFSKMIAEDQIVDDDERRAHHAQTMLERTLAMSSRIESRNAISLDRAMRRYATLQARELEDRASGRNEANLT